MPVIVALINKWGFFGYSKFKCEKSINFRCPWILSSFYWTVTITETCNSLIKKYNYTMIWFSQLKDVPIFPSGLFDVYCDLISFYSGVLWLSNQNVKPRTKQRKHVQHKNMQEISDMNILLMSRHNINKYFCKKIHRYIHTTMHNFRLNAQILDLLFKGAQRSSPLKEYHYLIW